VASLRKKYVQNAAALLGQSLGAGRYRDVTELDVATSLASCLADGGAFDLRLEVLSLHGSNLRWDPLAELFRWAVPDLQARIRSSDAVARWVDGNPDVSEHNLMSVLAGELEDLVERRNEVAHRAIPDEILSYDNLLAKASFIEAVALGLVASLGGVLVDCLVNNGVCESIGTPSERLKSGRVVVIPSLEAAVSEGDMVVLPAQQGARWGQVIEVQIAGQRVQRAEAGSEVGLLLDFVCRKSGSLYLWPTPLLDLSRPPSGLFGSRGPIRDR
jgi:hypothetical protein